MLQHLREHEDQSTGSHFQARFLCKLPHDGFSQVLAGLDFSARQEPATWNRTVFGCSDKQYPLV